jgi:4-amino-4-deoxy-L-arabinose transferase-like glycosyltransferase
MKSLQNNTLLFLAFLLLIGALRFFPILMQDRVSPVYDSLDLQIQSRTLFDAMGNPNVSVGFDSVIYPPLIHYVALPFVAVFGIEHGAQFSFFVYWIILVLCCFGIARHYAGERAGVIAAFLVGLNPLVDGYAKLYMVDFPLTAMTVLAVYFLLKSHNLSQNRYLVLGALSVSAGLFFKQSFVLVAGVPIVMIWGKELLRPIQLARGVWLKKAALFVGVAVGLPLIYYLPRALSQISRRLELVGSFADVEPALTIPFELFKGWVLHGLGPVFALGFFLTTLLFFPKFRGRLLFAWSLAPMLLIAPIVYFATTRYVLPMIPPALILVSLGIAHGIEKTGRQHERIITAGVIGFAGLSLFLAVWLSPQSLTFQNHHDRLQGRGVLRSATVPWSVEPIILKLRESGNGDLISLIDSPFTETLRHRLFLIDPMILVDSVFARLPAPDDPSGLERKAEAKTHFEIVRWVLVHDKYQKGERYIQFEGEQNDNWIHDVFDAFNQIKNDFTLAETFPYPKQEGGGNVLLYERTNPGQMPINAQ